MIAAERREYIPIPTMAGDVTFTFPPRADPYRVISVRASVNINVAGTGLYMELTTSLLPTTAPILIAQWGDASIPYIAGDAGSVTWSPNCQIGPTAGNIGLILVPIPSDLWITPNIALQLSLVSGATADVIDNVLFCIEPSGAR